jgi:hypothetical protein
MPPSKRHDAMRIGLLLATAALVVSCAQAPPTTDLQSEPSASPSEVQDSRFERLYIQPLPRGEQKSSVDDARREVSFPVLELQIGDPRSVVVLDLDHEGKEGASVALVYNSPSHGRIVLMETMNPIDFTEREAWEAWAEQEVANTGKAGVRGSSEFRVVRGERALLGVAESGLIGLRFYESGVEYSIFTPSLSKDDVVTLANGMK